MVGSGGRLNVVLVCVRPIGASFRWWAAHGRVVVVLKWKTPPMRAGLHSVQSGFGANWFAVV